MKNIITSVLVFTFFSANISFAQAPAIEWQNTIGGSGDDYLRSISQTSDGGYVLGGTSISGISGDKTEVMQGNSDYWVVKLDALGKIELQNTIGGDNFDGLYSIQQTSDGGYILGGNSSSGISGDKTEAGYGNSDYWVVKLDALGNIEWQNTIGGSNGDFLESLQQTADGGYILGGFSNSGISGDKTEASHGTYDYWVVKLDAGGQNIEWQNSIGGSREDYLHSLQQASDGGYILGGYSYSGISGDKTEANQGNRDYWVVKLDASGQTIEWQHSIGGKDVNVLQSLHQTSDGGYILGGESTSGVGGDKTEANQGITDYWVIKLKSSGTIEWQNTIGGDDYDLLFSIQQTTDGGYILGGYSYSGIGGDKTEVNQGIRDYWVVKLDVTGQIIEWQKTIGGNDEDLLYSLQQTFDGGYILGGFSQSGISGDKTEVNQGGWDYWVVKLAGLNNASVIISGYVQDSDGTGISGVAVAFSNGGASVYTDATGYYVTSVSNGWSGTSTVAKSGYTFNPANYSYSAVSTDQTNQDYIGTKLATSFHISGFVRNSAGFGIPGVSITFSNGGATVITDNVGYYITSVSSGWNGFATPYLMNYAFTPSKIEFNTVTSTQINQDYIGNMITLGVDDENSLPVTFTVKEAYPNPFNPSTTIDYYIPLNPPSKGDDAVGGISVQIYDITGKLVNTLIDQVQPSGWHSVQWNGKDQVGANVPAGAYLVRVKAGTEVRHTKVMLLK